MIEITDLPKVNASLNGLTTVLLLVGFYFVKNKNIPLHRSCMVSAIICSALFLGCYLTYHYFHGVTRFQGPYFAKIIYLTILFTHTLLATLILPMIFVTVKRAIKGDFEGHKKIARWTWPIWLYVSVTGVVIYWILYHLYPSN